MQRRKSLFRLVVEPLAIAIALGLLFRAAIHIYSIPSDSMAPTLLPGDQIVVTNYFGRAPERGDVIVFHSPAGDDELIVKRVVGVPGDLVDSRLGRVRIGGHTLPERYILRPLSSGAIEALVVPPGAYYVLGDNRDVSMDSRTWGTVRQDSIVGRARVVLWSTRSARGATARASVTDAQNGPDSNGRGRLFKWID